MLTTEPKMVNKISACSPISFKHMIQKCPNPIVSCDFQINILIKKIAGATY